MRVKRNSKKISYGAALSFTISTWARWRGGCSGTQQNHLDVTGKKKSDDGENIQ